MGVWVSDVIPGMAASRENVHQGDLIVVVNGSIAVHKSLEDVLELMRAPVVNLLLLEVLCGGIEGDAVAQDVELFIIMNNEHTCLFR